jgi:tetratricopeptide (TPR) repeat protein
MGLFDKISNHFEKIKLRDKCLSLVNEEKFPEAKDCFEKYLSESPDHGYMIRIYAFALWRLNLPDDALTALNKGLLVNATDWDLLENKLRILIEMGNYPEALSLIEKYGRKVGDKEFYQGVICSRTNHNQEALEYFDEAVRIAEKNINGWEPLLRIKKERSDYQKAVIFFNQGDDQKVQDLLKFWNLHYYESETRVVNKNKYYIGEIELANLENIKKIFTKP